MGCVCVYGHGINGYYREKRDRFAALNDTYRGVIEHLIDFLDEYYPPHAVDVCISRSYL